MRKTIEPRKLETLASRIRWIIEEREMKQVDFARSLYNGLRKLDKNLLKNK